MPGPFMKQSFPSGGGSANSHTHYDRRGIKLCYGPHFRCVVTQWVEEESTAVDTKIDINLARMPESGQNAISVLPPPANANSSHFVTINRYEGLTYRGNRDAYYCFDTHTKKSESLGTANVGEAQRVAAPKTKLCRRPR
jgi:hypothetical protein